VRLAITAIAMVMIDDNKLSNGKKKTASDAVVSPTLKKSLSRTFNNQSPTYGENSNRFKHLDSKLTGMAPSTSDSLRHITIETAIFPEQHLFPSESKKSTVSRKYI
jgi:hypothetical protein